MEFLKEVAQLYQERSEWFGQLICEHILLSLIAILLAGVIGLLLGILIARCEKAAPPVLGIANVFYTIPSISLLGMLIPFMGIGDKTAVVALTIYGIMPMVRNTYAGIKGVDEEIITAARGMGSTEFQILTRIKLPLALRHYCRRAEYGGHDHFCSGNRFLYRGRRTGSRYLQGNYRIRHSVDLRGKRPDRADCADQRPSAGASGKETEEKADELK